MCSASADVATAEEVLGLVKENNPRGYRTDTIVGANPSFHREGEDFTYSLEVIEDRVVELHDRGFQMIMAQWFFKPRFASSAFWQRADSLNS